MKRFSIGCMAMIAMFSLACGGTDPPTIDPNSADNPSETYKAAPKLDSGVTDSDAGHKCPGVCDKHFGWVYDCEGPPKVNCDESYQHQCHSTMCPGVCMMINQQTGGLDYIQCDPKSNPATFTFQEGTLMKDCNVGCPSGASCFTPDGTQGACL